MSSGSEKSRPQTLPREETRGGISGFQSGRGADSTGATTPLSNQGVRTPAGSSLQNGGRNTLEGVSSGSEKSRPQTLPREEPREGISGFQSGRGADSTGATTSAPGGAGSGIGGRNFPSNGGTGFPRGNSPQGGAATTRQDGATSPRSFVPVPPQTSSQQTILGDASRGGAGTTSRQVPQQVPVNGARSPGFPNSTSVSQGLPPQTILGNPSRTISPPAQQVQQQAPVSGARSTVVPSPSAVSQAPPQQATGGQRGVPQGGGSGGVPGRGAAPAGNAPPSGSGVSIGTTPASGTPAQPAQKKKPGDPGYIPGQ